MPLTMPAPGLVERDHPDTTGLAAWSHHRGPAVEVDERLAPGVAPLGVAQAAAVL